MKITYVRNSKFKIDPGFICTAIHVENSVKLTNEQISSLPNWFFQVIDYKTTSAIIGRIFSENLAKETKSQVNPIEKGHPDIIPINVKNVSEKILKNYPDGIEIKVTIGNVSTNSKLVSGQSRIDYLTGISWQAHHREVKELMGIIWDFDQLPKKFPIISGVFYANNLKEEDWGRISGTTGRNTKVTAMLTSGKEKMGKGNIVIIDNKKYLEAYQKRLNFKLPK